MMPAKNLKGNWKERELPRIEVIPMEVTVGDDSFLYGLGGTLSVKQFYAMQRGGKFATTSQINPFTYKKAFEPALKAGYDILYLGFSSGMSGCFNNARLCMEELKEEYPDRKLYFKVKIDVQERFAPEDVDLVHYVATIIQGGDVRGRWSRYETNMTIVPQTKKNLTSSMDKPYSLTYAGSATVNIFGNSLQ